MADANNIEIQQQLNKLLMEQKKIMLDNTRSLREQADLTKEMANALSNATISNTVVDKSRNLSESLKIASDHAKEFSKQSQNMSSMTAGALEDTDNGFEGLIGKYGEATSESATWAAATGGFVEGISKGFNILKTGLSGVLSLAGSVVQGMFSIGKAILAVPFSIFNAFIKEANRMQGEPLLAREFEETRKAFGDFGEDLSKNVIAGYKNLRGELAETGLSTTRVLGYMHERLKFVREQFEALGPVAHQFGTEIAQQSEYFAAYQKGLGLSGEMMKSLAQSTQGTGSTFEETLRTTTNFTTSLGKQFGISQKVIGRDVGEMSKDLKTFGSVGVREMAQMSVYARKLGADFKDLLGVVDKFDNFEDAAESAARLAQAFGLNIDAMDMMAEQDPAKRIDMLRKSFYQTGKDITKLTRQERNYLAASAGIEDQALNAVFALDKQGQSYDEISAAGQSAEQSQITQAEAMEKLSDSIERMIKSGSRTGGFFDRFMQGFRRGVRWSGEFRDVMINIKKSLWAAERAGRKVGHAFVNAFPGIKKLLDGMKDFFNPKKFQALGGKVVSAFKKFFKELGDPTTAKKALSNLLSALKSSFLGMENSQSGAMSKIIEGFKQMFAAVGQIILSSAKIAIENLGKFIKALVKVVKGESSFGDAISEMFEDGANSGASMFLGIWEEITEQLGPVTAELKDAFIELMKEVWEKIKKWWEKIEWGPLFKKVAKKILSSDVGKILVAAIVGPKVLSMLTTVLTKYITGAGAAMSAPFAAAFLGAAAVALAAYIGYAVSQSIKESQEYFDFLETSSQNIEAIHKKRLAVYDTEINKMGVTKTALESLYSKEGDLIQGNIKLLIEKNALNEKETWTLKNKMIEDMRTEQDKITAEITKLTAAQSKWGMISYDKEREAEIENLQGKSRAIGDEMAGVEASIQRALAAAEKGQGYKDALKAKGKKSEPAKKTFDTSEIISQFEQAKGINPSQIKKMEANLKESTELITRKGGLKDMMGKIKNAFADFDLEAFARSVGSISALSNLSKSIEEISKSKINISKVSATLDDSKTAFMKIVELVKSISKDGLKSIGEKTQKISDSITNVISLPMGIAEISKSFSGMKKNFKSFSSGDSSMFEGLFAMIESMLSGFSMITVQEGISEKAGIVESISDSVLGMSSQYTEMKAGLSDFSKVKEITSLPVVQGIIKLVEASNTINKELSGLTTFNVRPKLENLGKVLGLRGNESLKIEHENFNVDINVTVELDPNKLADAVVSTGKVVKSVKTPRK